ncbi:MAG: hypothetical protein KAJ18_08615 [Candidatus Omnitrophica bacterium]|nr:hypothetical protein [Candidatus Omnitrophota bacterium]
MIRSIVTNCYLWVISGVFIGFLFAASCFGVMEFISKKVYSYPAFWYVIVFAVGFGVGRFIADD